MLPLERQQKIKDLIRTRHNMGVKELSGILGVSEMTVHRDIKPLIQEGLIMKTFGGITLVREEPGHLSDQGDCMFCYRKIDLRLTYRLILTGNRVEAACCAHCGLLRQQQLGDEVLQAICHDFFTQTTISAPLTWFVMDAPVGIGCCQPQVLTFGKKEYAQGFVKGFGGSVLSMEEAMVKVQADMKTNPGDCCQSREQD